MGLYTTAADDELLYAASNALGNSYPHLAQRVSPQTRQVLGLRLVLSTLALKPGRNTQRTPTWFVQEPVRGQILLAKLRNHYGNKVDEDYLVTSQREMFTIPQLGAFYKQWRRSERMGSDIWPFGSNESVMWAMCQLFESNVPAVMSALGYRSIIEGLVSQAHACAEFKQRIEQTKEAPETEDVFLKPNATLLNTEGGQSSQRLTNCYTCAAAKPPQVACQVCGRIPKGRAA
jgi:hypothetical protein